MLAPLFLIATWGCGSSSSDGTTSGSDGGNATGGNATGGNATGGSAAATGGSTTGGNATGGDGATTSSGGSAGGRTLTIELYSLLALNTAHLQVLDSTPDPSIACTTLRVGDCSLTTCPIADSNTPHANDLWFKGGEVVTGTIDRAGAAAGETSHATATLIVNPKTNANAISFTPNIFLVGEEQITADISGGTLPAYRYAMQMPLSLITTTAPSESSSGGKNTDYIHLSRQTDRVLEWQRGVPNVTYYVLQATQHQARGNSYLLSCAFDSTLGTGTIPAQLLADLPTGTEFHTVGAIDRFVQVDGGTYRFLTFAHTVNPAKQNAVELKLSD